MCVRVFSVLFVLNFIISSFFSFLEKFARGYFETFAWPVFPNFDTIHQFDIKTRSSKK